MIYMRINILMTLLIIFWEGLKGMYNKFDECMYGRAASREERQEIRLRMAQKLLEKAYREIQGLLNG